MAMAASVTASASASSRWPCLSLVSKARAAATRACAGALLSAAISVSTCFGSSPARSTPASAFANAVAREGRPPRRREVVGFIVFSPLHVPCRYWAFASASGTLRRCAPTRLNGDHKPEELSPPMRRTRQECRPWWLCLFRGSGLLRHRCHPFHQCQTRIKAYDSYKPIDTRTRVQVTVVTALKSRANFCHRSPSLPPVTLVTAIAPYAAFPVTLLVPLAEHSNGSARRGSSRPARVR